MRWNVYEVGAGTTFKPTWVNTGQAPSPITSALIDRTQVVVSSVAAVSSTNGAYFALHQMPTTPGPYVNEWRATIGGQLYVNRQLVKNLDMTAD